jgi:3-phosphoshikimate 1-carboxyvinyltransferase
MAARSVSKVSRLKGSPRIPGDKSISHRGLIFGALARGRTEVEGILESGDVQSTGRCLRALGVKIEKAGDLTLIDGIGGGGLRKPTEILDCGNSGTTMRVLMGVLAGRGVEARMTGDDSLVKRPMKRVAEPLKLMGASFELTNGDFAPLTVHPAKLRAIDYALKIASAQVKTAILMAALSAEGTTRLTGEILSRDHTERMLRHFGAEIFFDNSEIRLRGGQELRADRVRVPGDPSTAAFWLGAAALVPGARVELSNVSLNPTRIGFVHALQRMGAGLELRESGREAEPIGTIVAGHAPLRGVKISREEVPTLIDELPLLAVLATQAHGITVVEGAEELRVKETDRIEAVATNLRAMGGVIETRPDGYVIEGPQKLKGADVKSFHDHRIAMAFSIAGLVADGPTTIHEPECVSISYPGFFDALEELTR